MRHAAIDIGTNSAKLLIADVSSGQIRKVLHERVIITRLGENLSTRKKLQPGAIKRTLKVLKSFAALFRRTRVENPRCVSTKVLRDARNGEAFIRQCAALGLTIRIISGREEARLGYLGALSNLSCRHAMSIDIGGGSTEVSVGHGRRFQRGVSLNMGAVVLTERFLRHDPPTADEIRRMNSRIAKICSHLKSSPGILVGIGGTVTTLGFICRGERMGDPRTMHNTVLTMSKIRKAAEHLSTLTVRQRQIRFGLEPGRADIMLAGAHILIGVMERLGKPLCRISVRGVRYGLILGEM